jgi:chaperonin cofactor prefoldin
MGQLEDLRNAIGKITINKEELQNDIKDIEKALNLLEQAREIVKPDINKAVFEGEASAALENHLVRLHKSMETKYDECAGTASFMKKVLEEFKRTEIDLQNKINSIFNK